MVITATSNAVNLTDGLDGLATGSSAMVFAAYVIIAFWQFGNSCVRAAGPGCYEVRDPLDLALVAAAAMGACFGFLWWNASPAKIFMGDTGSLAIGGTFAGIAILTQTELLLVVLGGLFVLETLSVILQVGYFKATRKRVFNMAPIHPPLRAGGVAGEHRHRAVLDHRRARRRVRPGAVLRGVPVDHAPVMTASYEGRAVLVAGAGVTGAAVARALRERGSRVSLADGGAAELVRAEGFEVRDLTEVPDGTDLVVVSPGWRPDNALLLDAGRRGVDTIGEVELARRLAGPDGPAWLAVTGTNGKTTTVTMLEHVLRAAGHRTVAAGNIGLPLVEAVTGPYDVLAVELSSFQLHWSPDVPVVAGAVLNLADDHVDWHGSVGAYAEAKTRVWRTGVAVGNRDDPAVATLLAAAAGRQVGTTLQSPRPGELGVVEDLLVDRAFADVPGEATALAELGDLGLPGDHNVSNALAALALARAFGVPGHACRDGLRATPAGAHRNEVVATVAGVTYVDDSKATNPHAAGASLSAYDRVVWVAGGLLKGADVEPLVAAASGRLRAAVLLGADRAPFREALARHAPHLPVVEVTRTDTACMLEAVRAAASLAEPEDTVLLAPAAASFDCFADYAERGRLFADAVRGLG